MEELNIAKADESRQSLGLHAEWLESQVPNIATSNNFELAFANITSDKQINPKSSDAPAPSSAEKLDQELRDFANARLDDPSRDMLQFQKAIGKFCNTSDKQAAMDDLGDTWSKINSLAELKSEALFNETRAEASNTPGRNQLEAAYKEKHDQLIDKALNLPFEESERVMDLIKRQPDESKEQFLDRVRKGLANNKPMLDAFNDMQTAEDKIEANKGPREKQLEHLSEQLRSDSQIMQVEIEKAYLRSTLP